MSSHDRMMDRRRVLGALSLGLLVSGCFTPMYAVRTTGADGKTSTVATALAQIEVKPVGTRVALEVRNALIFELSGGAGNPIGAPYQLELVITPTITLLTSDQLTGRAGAYVVQLEAVFTMRDAATNKIVMTDRSSATTGVDRAEMVFARDRSIRDAQNRAAKTVAEQIRMRLTAYFATRV